LNVEVIKRYILIVFSLFLICYFAPGLNNDNAPDRILWQPGYKLQWKDFKGKPDNNAKWKATTICEIKAEFPFSETSNKYYAIVKCYFIKSKSWVKKDPTDYLLNHEQMHFDMGEVFCRKMRKEFSEKTFSNNVFAKESQKIYEKTMKDYAKEQELYDKETNHSLIKEKQEEWNQKIAAELEALEKYKLN